MARMICAALARAAARPLCLTPLHPMAGAPPSGGLDTSIVVALIGLGGVIIGGLIAGFFALYQANRSARLAEKAAFLQKELERRLLQEERAQQQQEQSEEAARAAMLRACTREERVVAYRRSLHADPRIARLQILDMTWPMEISDIYVQVRLHQEPRLGFHSDADQSESERHDPNVLLEHSQALLEQRVAAALPPERVLQINKHCVVVGDPGAGKSTLLKHLALRSVDRGLPDLPDLPIHVELQAFAISAQRGLLDFIAAQWEERYGFPQAEALAYLQSVLTKGQALLLLDALDETVTGITREEAEESYRRVSQVITNLATHYSLVPIIVTARKAGYHQRAHLPGFTEVEVLDFRQEEIAQFIERWFAAHTDRQRRGNAPDLLARLERNPRIYALAANPLLLSLIVLVYENQLDLPERRAELYKQCVDTLLIRWDASRNIRRRREFKPEQKRLLLEEIAWHFHLQGQRYFREPELLQCVAAFLPVIGLGAEQQGEVLAEIAAEHGLLKEQAHGWYGFLHLTLQEYFAAQYAADHQQLEVLLSRRDDPWWEEVLLLYTGRLPDASTLLQRLLAETYRGPDQDSHNLFATDLLLAGRCLGAAPTVRQISLRAEITDRLFLLLQTTLYTLTQEQVSRTLVEIGGDAVVSQLLALLSDQQVDLGVRMSIAGALATLGDRSLAPQLLTLLSDQQMHWWPRMSIAGALATLGDRSLAPQLLAMLSDQQMDLAVRSSIADALATLGDRSLAPQLLTLLSDKQMHRWPRMSIAGALGRLGDRSLAPQLLTLLSDQQVDSGVRSSIADALATLGDRSLAPQLLAMLHDEQVDSGVRIRIADALATLGDCSLAPQLLVLLHDEQVNPSVRSSIANALATLGDRSLVPQLLALLHDQQVDSGVRIRTADTLGKLGDRSLAPQLLAMLHDQQMDPSVRTSIVLALSTLGDRSLAPQLLAMLHDQQVDSGVRIRIALALGKLGDRSLAPQLLALLHDQQVDSGVHMRIALTLGTLGDHSLAPQLLALLHDQQVDSGVRMHIADALATLGDNEEQIRDLAALLPVSDISDDIHRALWKLSRQLGVRIYVSGDPESKMVNVVSVSARA